MASLHGLVALNTVVSLSIDECLLHETFTKVSANESWLMVLRAGVRVVGESELRALGGCLGAKRR